jgi:hypothetical protein
MANVALTTASSALLAADADQWRNVFIANLGPNTIFFELGATATTTGSQPVPTNQTVGPIPLPPATAINAIVATANQTSPADTRVIAT